MIIRKLPGNTEAKVFTEKRMNENKGRIIYSLSSFASKQIYSGSGNEVIHTYLG